MSISYNNGVIRIGRKGIKKFAFGEDDSFCKPFDVDVVNTFQKWINIVDNFRTEENEEGDRSIPKNEMIAYHEAAVAFVTEVSGQDIKITTSEALDFLARLREQYDELAVFFQVKSPKKQESQDTSEETSRRFSEEPEINNLQTSTS